MTGRAVDARLSSLRRPRLLVQAARHVVAEDRRPRHPLTAALEIEAECEDRRRAGDPLYSSQVHVLAVADVIRAAASTRADGPAALSVIPGGLA